MGRELSVVLWEGNWGQCCQQRGDAGGAVGICNHRQPLPRKAQSQQTKKNLGITATSCQIPPLCHWLSPPGWLSSCSLLIACLGLVKLLKPRFLSCSAQPSVPVPHPQEQLPQPHLELEPWTSQAQSLGKTKLLPVTPEQISLQ